MITRFRAWVGIFIGIFLLILFFVTADIQRMATELATANYLFLLPGLIAYLLSIMFRTIRWQLLLDKLGHVSLVRLYPIVVIGYMANNILPMRMGELVRSYCLWDREAIPKTAALVTIFVERILDGLTLVSFVIILAFLIPMGSLFEGLSAHFGLRPLFILLFFSIPFVFAFLVILIFAYKMQSAHRIVISMINIFPRRIRRPANRILDITLLSLSSVKDIRVFPVILVISIPIWLLEAVLFFFVGLSFSLNEAVGGLTTLIAVSLLITAIANIGSSIPAAPGGIGLFEIITREALVLLPIATIDRATAAGYAAVVHMVLLLSMIALGQLFLWSGNTSLPKLLKTRIDAN